jgi:hypothetical protein
MGQMPHHLFTRLVDLKDAGKMFLGDKDNMNRGFGGDVLKGIALRVFVDLG